MAEFIFSKKISTSAFCIWVHTHRFALALFMYVQEMTPEADIISTRYTKSVIKSAAALSYVEAQARMDDRYAFISL